MTSSRIRRPRVASKQHLSQTFKRRLHHETLERRELLAAEIFGPSQEQSPLFATVSAATTAVHNWQPLGPFAATNGQVENITPGNEVVGAIHTALAHPTNTDILYIGAANGGVWRTNDATAVRPSWTPLTDDLPSQSIGALTFDQADTSFQTIYAGTGRFSSFGRIGGDRVGVLRTTDGGDNWSVLDGDGVLAGKNISGIYANGSTIVVSVNTATPFNESNVGIFRSVDGGSSFTRVSVGNGNGPTGLPGGVSYDLVADPVNPDILYTSTTFSGNLGGGRIGIYKSLDRGATWRRVSSTAIETLIDNGTTNITGTSNLELAVGRFNNVYAAIINTGELAGLFRSADGGATWTQMETPSTNEGGTDFGLNPRGIKGPPVGSPIEDIAGGQGGIHFSIVADTSNPNIVYVGGDRQPLANEGGGPGPGFPNSLGARDFTGRLFRGDASQPIGNQFVHLTHSNTLGRAGGGTANSSAPHADSRELVFDANGDLIEVDDGGIYRRTNPTSNTGDWFSIIGNLQVTEAHDVAWDSVSNIAITGNQDTGTTQQPFEGALIWESVSTADGGDVVVDDISLAGSGRSIRYSSFQNLGAFRKRTYDASGGVISTTFPALNVTGGGSAFQGAFSTPVELNSVDPTRLVFQGSNAAYDSFDQGETLVEIPVAGTLTSGNRGITQNAIIAGGVLNGAPNDDLLWVGSGNNVLLRTTAGGSLARPASQPPIGQVRDIAVNPNDFGSVFVVDNNQVVASSDLGNSWRDVTGNLLSRVSELWSVSYVIGPLVDAVVVGTNLGVFASAATSPGTWNLLGLDLPNVPIFDMEWDSRDDVLISGTLGRGAWLLDNASDAITSAVLGAEILDGPNLIAIRPDAGQLLLDGDVMNEAPREFNLLFDGAANLDESTINTNTIKLIRSGGDGIFGDGDDVEVAIGYVGLVEPGSTDPADQTQIVMRPASSASFNANDPENSFPDDAYQILIVGSGATPLTNTFGIPFNQGVDVIRSFDLDRGAQVVAVDPQPISRNSQRLDLGGASGGTFVLSFSGASTAPIPFNASGASIVAAIEALPNVQPGDVVVSGSGEFTFAGQFAGEQAPLMIVNSAGLIGGTATVTRLTKLSQASNQIVIYLDDQELDPTQAIDPAFYRLIDTSGSMTGQDDQTILAQRVTYDSNTNKVVLFFANDLPEGNYRLDVGSSGGQSASLATAVRVGTLFNTSVFSKNGFLGDRNGLSEDGMDIDLYQTSLRTGTTINVNVTPQSNSLDVRVRLLDLNGNPLVSANVGPGSVTTLSHTATTSNAVFVEVSSEDGSTGSYLIDFGVTGNPVSTSDANSSLASATQFGSLGDASLTIRSSIQPQSIPLPPRPGSEDEPGHRQIQREQHIGALGTGLATPNGTVIRRYYFPAILGTDASGNPYPNLITETEKQIVRDIYEIYAQHSGYEFIESTGGGTAIGKGDLRAIDPTLGPNDGVAGLGGPGSVTLNGAIFNQANRVYGDGFTGTMFHEIGHSLRLGHSYDIPSNMGAGVPNDVLPGDHDIVHLQRIVPSNSTDVDLYQFDVVEPGRLRVETIAERLATPSLLNTALKLYRRMASGDIELVAQNDQYYGSDSALDLNLEVGTYFIGVTSTGNSQYDPRIADSGYGGTTDGAYDLEIRFDAKRDGTLLDTRGTEFDGDADGTPGGVYSFWFQASDPSSTLYVDKLADVSAGPNGTGQLASPYDTIQTALDHASTRIVVPVDAADSIAVGQQFVINDGTNLATFTFGTSGPNPVNIAAANNANDVVNTIVSAINSAIAGGRLSSSVGVSSTGRTIRLAGIDHLDLSGSATLLATPNLVRIVGNTGADGNLDTLLDNRPYLVGVDQSGNPLPDGAEFLVPQGVTVMIHAGALLKMRSANLDAGSSSDVSRAGAAIQVLGTPNHAVFLRSYHDDTVGGNSDGFGPAVSAGDFGGIVFRDDSDLEAGGIYLNRVNHADIRHAGGRVFVNSARSVYTAVHIVDARPTVSFNKIADSADAAVSASPDSFDDSNGRIGPDVHGNFLVNNTFDALFVRIETDLGSTINKLDVNGRFNDTDITHVLTENLIINGAGGGPIETATGVRIARPAGRLTIDPGTIVKLSEARIEAERGAGALIAEGTLNRPVIFTSIADDRYGGSGSFDVDKTVGLLPNSGDWGGLFFGQATSGSIDNALIQYGGGITPIEGGAAAFNAVEIHQADVRIAGSRIQFNADGDSNGTRNGRGQNTAATIYVRGSQPLIVDNMIADNAGAAISINANSLNFEGLRDSGRATGFANSYAQFADNHGPLVRMNRLENNDTNGMLIRGEVLTTESIWDDTDMVHVLQNEIVVDNLHTYGGLTLQSSNSESLVVKLAGNNAGLTATGTPQEILDRVGGTIHILGRPGHPVVMTSISDDTVGAGFTPKGLVNTNTNNSSSPSSGNPGGWRGLRFDEFSNDRNVAIVHEAENTLTNGIEFNQTPNNAQRLGTLAPDLKSGDENRRLGFVVKGFISPDAPNDVDVYSFEATAGTPIWIDIDRTDTALDAIVEVISSTGAVVARSVRSSSPTFPGNLNALTLTQNPLLGGDHYTQNFRDPGLFFVPSGNPGEVKTLFVRVRSNPTAGAVTTLAGGSRGEYQLQIRMDQVQEFPGSTVRFADIRYAQTGIDVRGLPAHSPLVGEAGELETANDTFAAAQQLVNLLQSDAAALSIAGALSGDNDIDWYSFDVMQTGVQVIGGVNDDPGTVAVVFDLDYADGAVRGDFTIAVFDQDQNLIFVSRESNVEDDQPLDSSGTIDDLSRGTLGKKDPYIGPIHVSSGSTYYVAVMSDHQLPTALTGVFEANLANAENGLVRLEPINSVQRIVEDHIGFVGYGSQGVPVEPTQLNGLFDISSAAGVDASVTPFALQDVALYLATDANGATGDRLYTVDPFASNPFQTLVTPGNTQLITGVNDIQDIVIRSDGRMFGYQRLNNVDSSAGALVELNPANIGTIISTQNDNVFGPTATWNVSLLDVRFGNANQRADEFTATDEVDALTFERLGTTGPANAPVPIYQTFYSVRESDSSSKLFLGDESGNAAPRLATATNPQYGYLGHIQPAGVTFATTTLTVRDNAATPDVTDIRIKAKTPGTTGNNIIINITRPNNTNANVVSVVGNQINLAIGGTGGPPITGAPTAGAIVDAINNDPDASALVTAVIVGGNGNNNTGANGTTALNLSLAVGLNPLTGGSDDVVNPPVRGRVTGLSFGNFYSTGNLFGVSSGGDFIEINPANGRVVSRLHVNTALASLGLPNAQFEGLALGPQNVESGAYANTVFATTTDGSVFAFDTTAMAAVTDGTDPMQVLSVMRQVFDRDGDDIADSYRAEVSGTGAAIGLAFSPLDFNLFHPTLKRATDRGHGINETPDGTRSPTGEELTIVDRDSNQGEGGASFHFGFEQWVQNLNANTDAYLTYDPTVNAQFGIFNTDFHADLSSNPAIRGTYNFPAGAYGSLTTDSFSLAGSHVGDRPTLYFNYFLDTENHEGSNVGSDGNDPFRDSARVFASRDGGITWELLATNNSELSNDDPTNANGTAEIAGFLSHLSDAGLNSATPRVTSSQIVQELFDNTGQWRQARVDLSTFAGEADLQLRVDFSTAGAMGDSSLGAIDASFGELTDNNRSIRSLQNAFEGFYIDDIIVGYAERGEMVTGTVPDSTITNLFGNARTTDRDPMQFPDILAGRYQLEVRRTESEYIFPNLDGDLFVADTFDTNERHINEPVGAANSTGLLADRNRERVQGVFIIDSNFITDSSILGINVQPGITQAGGSVPHPGSTINFPQLNNTRLVPGVVIENNVIAGSSGIRFAGETVTGPQRPVPFGRIVNNTLVGDNFGGVGIDVVGMASPTLLNNLITLYGTGVRNNGMGTVIRANFFQNNANDGSTGTAAIQAAAGDPLFLDATNGNYYLRRESRAVDSSQDTEQERFGFLAFKTELGIPASPIIAPENDVYGQLRVDSDASGGGAGSTVFKDRGAVDRSDTDAPFAQLLNPVDNDVAGQDQDPSDTIVWLRDQLLENFTILLKDGRDPSAAFEGTGVDGQTVADPTDSSVAMNAIAVTENGILLVQGIDYNVGYNAVTGVLLLTPLSTLWNPASVYVITLNNNVIADRAGNLLRPNQTDGETRFTVIMPQVEIDFGDSPDTYRTLLANDGARHAAVNDLSPRLGRFVDGEINSLGVNRDDVSVTIAVESNIDTPGSSGPFTFTGSTLTLTRTPVSRDNLRISVGGEETVFELISDVDAGAGVQLAVGRIPVFFVNGETSQQIAKRLSDAIRTHFDAESLPATTRYDATIAPLQISIFGLDDEDGVPAGSFVGATTTHGLFLDIRNAGLDSQNQPSTSNPAYVVAFLNIADASGAVIDIPVVGDGVLDAWIDFDRDGMFEPNEKAIDGAAVANGNNRFRIFSHDSALGATTGLTWARFRVTSSGIDTPYGLANDGEVEDHRVQIFNIAAPTLRDDPYTIEEDAIPASDGSDAVLLSANDSLPVAEFIRLEYILDLLPLAISEQNPTQENKFKSPHGVVTLLDASTGLIDYQPDANFNGTDVFRYRVTTQRNDGLGEATPVFAEVTFTINAINDAPVFPPSFETEHFIQEIDPGAPSVVTIDVIPTVGEMITAGPLTALDELNPNNQAIRIEVIPLNVPGGTLTEPYGPLSLMSQAPELLADGTLSLFPTPDAYGVAVFEIRVTDTAGDGSPLPDSLTTTRRLTITIGAENDPPIAQDYVRTVSESVAESTGVPVPRITFTAADLLDIGGARSAHAHLRHGMDLPELFDEHQQQLRVVEFLIPNPAGGADRVVRNSVTEIVTVSSGKLSFTFSAGVFVSGVYEPAIDYNDTTPFFAAPEIFQYIIEDFGPIDVPGTDFVNRPNPGDTVTLFRARSAPASITFNVQPSNDAPIVPAFAAIPAQPEFATGGPASFTVNLLSGTTDSILPGPLTALDELGLQTVAFTFVPVSVPGSVPNSFGPNSLLLREPTLTTDGLLTVFPTPEAYGVAVLEVRMTDVLLDGSDLPGAVTQTRLLTITINGTNDRPVARDRQFFVREAVETEGQSTTQPAYQIRFTKADLLRLDLIADGSDPEPAFTHLLQGSIDTTFDEREQNLRIVSVADGNESFSGAIDGVRTMTTPSGGRIDFTFSGGELVEGVYIPVQDFNHQTPLTTDDTFTFIVEDYGTVTNPGASFVNDPAIPTSIDLGSLASAAGTVTLTVLPVNDRPIFSGGNSVSANEDAGPRTFPRWATGIQAGPAGARDELSEELVFDLTLLSGDASLLTSPPVIAISGSDATLSFESAPDRNGVLVYELQLREVNGPNDPANGDLPFSQKKTFTITINSINDRPTFTAGGIVEIDEDSGPYSALWATGISPGPAEESTTQTIARFELTLTSGAATSFAVQPTIGIDGTLRFTPAANAAGNFTFNVVAIDSLGLASDPQILTISIEDFDDSPVPVDDFLDGNEDDVLMLDSADLLFNDIDPDLQTNPNEFLTVVMPGQITTLLGATVTVTRDAVTNQITKIKYDPTTSQMLQKLAPGESLVDRFSYGVTDADGEDPIPMAEVVLTIAGRNDAPDAVNDTLSVSPDATTILRPLANDTDIDGMIDPASIIITEQPTQGSLSIETNGTLLYTPGPNFSGIDSFRYTVGDNLGQQSEQATVNLSASGAPSAAGDVGGTFMGGPVDIDVLSNDATDAGSLNPTTLTITTPPSHGTAVPQPNGTVRYTPNPNYTGPDSFAYTVADTSGRISNASTVTLNVVQSRLQNPLDFMDVNASGEITSLDALLIVNRLSRAGNVTSVPVEAPDRGPNFYDVSGDLNISASDAFRVINFLSRQQSGQTEEGEARIASNVNVLSTSVISGNQEAPTLSSDNLVRAAEFAKVADKIVATSRLELTPLELIELLAMEHDRNDGEDDRNEAIDAAIASLLSSVI